jgi:uncharacterized damage-inducible protein DinB
MNHLIEAYKQSKSQKEWMIQQVEKSTLDGNSIKPDEKWSQYQLLFHLYHVEQSILDYIQYKYSNGELIQEAGIKAKMRYFTLKLMLLTKLKFKAPKKVSEMPESIDFISLKKDWNKTQHDFETFLTNFPKELSGIAVFKHPYAGFLSMEQTIAFIVDHAKHHRFQMERLVR